MPQSVLLILVSIGLLSLFSQWLAWRLKVPAILFLLASGLLMGPVTGVLNPDQLFGALLFPFISLAVAVIIFEGSLTLNLEEIRGHGVVVRRLISWGLAIVWLLVAAMAHWLVGLDWEIAFLFGAIMTVTGPTVIMPMLQAVRPTRPVSNILRWEGILVDPLGAIFAVITFSVVVATQESTNWLDLPLKLVYMFGVGGLIGGIGGWFWGLALRRYWIPQFLHNVATLLVVFAIFALSDAFAHESGLLAVTVMGVWLANTPGIHIRSLLDFKESLSILLISALFILLAARLDFDQLQAIGWPALVLMLGIQFFARPLKVALCTVGASLNWRERVLLAWIGPRGIVAAAITAVFAERLMAQGVEGAEMLVPLAFAVIVGTVALQSVTARPLALALDAAAPAPEGVLIVGANTFSIPLGKALSEAGFNIIVTDNDWDSLRKARMAGLRTYYGNPMSDHAERTLDLSGIGRLFAVSRNGEFNRLACTYFAHQFGRQGVYRLPVTLETEDDKNRKSQPSRELPGRRLFAEDVSLSKLQSFMSRGAEIKATRLSENYSFEQFLEDGHKDRILLGGWNERGRLLPYAKRWADSLEPGWTVASLSLERAEMAEKTD